MPDHTTSTDSITAGTGSMPSMPKSGLSFDPSFHDELQEHYKLSQLSEGERSEAQQTRFTELQSKLGPQIDALNGTSAE